MDLDRLLGRQRIEQLLEGFTALLGLTMAVENAKGTVVAGSTELDVGTTGVRRPILVGDDTIGWAVAAPAPDPAGGNDALAGMASALVAHVLAERAAAEVETEGLASELLARYEEVTLLYDLSEAFGSALDPPALCDVALERSLRAIEASTGIVTLLDPDGSHAVAAVRRLHPEPSLLAAAEAVAAAVTMSGKEVLVHEGEAWPGSPASASEAGATGPAMLSVPLVPSARPRVDHRPIGALTLVGRRAGKRFTASDARLAGSVACQLGIAIENSRLVQARRVAEGVQRELEIAARIQQGLLPGPPPELPDVALAGLCVPATRVGGDYYDFLLDGADRITLVVADVAGHSIGSALMMAMARSVLRREVAAGRSPCEVLAATNDAMLEDLTVAGLFITAFCARYDRSTGELAYASGGHNPPLLYRAATATTTNLDADGMPIGVLGGVHYEEQSVGMATGDLVLLFTDGVVEARDAVGEQFGEERLSCLVAGTAPRGPRILADEVYAAVVDHVGAGSQQDDVTLLALQSRAS